MRSSRGGMRLRRGGGETEQELPDQHTRRTGRIKQGSGRIPTRPARGLPDIRAWTSPLHGGRPMKPEPKAPDRRAEEAAEREHEPAEPVAEPMPKMDGPKPVPAGKDAVEKFLVSTDTAGGD